MKKLLIPSLSLGLLVNALLASQAFTLYVDNTTTHPNTADVTYEAGVVAPNTTPGGPSFVNFFTPDNNDNTFSAAYGTPSVVNFGTTTTVGGDPTKINNGVFAGGANSTVTFAFDLQNGSHSGGADTDPIAAQDAFDKFVVTGTLLGSVGYGAGGAGTSTAKVTFGSIFNQSATGLQQTTSTLATNPNNGLLAQYIQAKVGTQSYDIYINQVQDIPKPGQTLTISGYVRNSTVPEPGSMALLLGFGVTGAAFLRRRKK